VVATALQDMKAAWSRIEQVQPEYVRSEINPRFVNIATPDQLVIKIEINVEVEQFQGKMFFCIPYAMVESANQQLYSTGVQADENENANQWHDVLKEILINAYTNLTVEIAKTEITFEDLMKFEVGSVISLNKPVSEASIGKIEGRPKFKGFPGQSRGSAAIKLPKTLLGLPGMSGSST
jgi:flagellar motor switch protein FliM